MKKAPLPTGPKHKYLPGERRAAQAYAQGYDAAHNKRDSAEPCAYVEGTSEHQAWCNGFADGKEDLIESEMSLAAKSSDSVEPSNAADRA